MVLLVTYDLHTEPRDYADVIDVIKSAGSYAHLEESVWLIETSSTPETWRDKLKAVESDATYFVVRLAHNWASSSLDQSIINWLKGDRDW
jgi:hypothetical protein